MATDLVGNVQLQRFIELLSALNHQSVEFLKSGNTQTVFAMNDTVEEMYSIQRDGTEDAYTAIDDDMQAIYKNFNAVVLMLKSNETQTPDPATGEALKKFVRNIFDATVRIVYAYGLA